MTFATFLDSKSLGVELRSPEYFVVYENTIYAVDSGLNSLIIIDDEFDLVSAPKKEFTFAEGVDPKNLNLREGSYKKDPETDEIIALTLDKPEGLDVKELGIYIADTNNRRIIRLNHDFEVLEVFSDPEDPVFEEIAFQPIKITVDVTGRMYVVA